MMLNVHLILLCAGCKKRILLNTLYGLTSAKLIKKFLVFYFFKNHSRTSRQHFSHPKEKKAGGRFSFPLVYEFIM